MNTPLVSVAVITYNSSQYVIETLESIKKQTYQNIELIISDDCSTDDTVEVCTDWIAKNKERFPRTQIIVSNKNTGIAANCNRAEDACRGEWIKIIAGDEWINALQKYIQFYFLDKETVKYRVGHGVSLPASGGVFTNSRYYKSTRLYEMYYVFENLSRKDKNKAVQYVVEYEVEQRNNRILRQIQFCVKFSCVSIRNNIVATNILD